ncbi:3-deoxy-D-manno-octulosonic acid transferase [Magnetospirillum molischianum]|uniref:3-deoxy-D-manno-octulosonic acid transferase n=1 Tax=Magnetospirillum molischianum DSM 120 TaxID=1150626 RepID=H8FU03_MAGML|nr:3-deoxy-D-manno-octulosonic acid transferase [Magnetospirillum molischianum]CCG41727.1 3-deoxy-D-manno-octulosonic-acid transferase (KDO transferase) [Magnetospirillum molischianum DSM 120]
MIYDLYRRITDLGGPLISLYLDNRRHRGKEDPARFGERLGQPSQPRPPGPLVWVHAASVGESLSVLPLVGRLRRRGLGVLLTTGTVTSARMVADRLPEGAIHQYQPVDRTAYVSAFLDHWQPDLMLWTESDFWPNMLSEAKRRAIPMVLVQGRISPRSYARWRYLPDLIGKMLGGFDLCLAQTEADAGRLRDLGGGDVRCLGNLKYAVPPLPGDEAELERLRAAVAGRAFWLAASTHPGEEAIIASVHRHLAERFPSLLTLIVPRHPGRGPDIARKLIALGLSVAMRSAGETPRAGTAIHIADTMGELGVFYRLSDIVFMGKSLTVGGGQNPFEPARLGCAVLFGPRMENFPDMTAHMVAAGAAIEVKDADDMAKTLGALLADPERLNRMKAAAAAWAETEAEVLDVVETALAPFLRAAERRHARP